MLAVVDGALALDGECDETAAVEGCSNEALVDDAAHGEGVVAGDEGHVIDGCVADNALFGGGERESYVAQCNSDDRWVGNVCKSFEIWLAGCGGAVDCDAGDVESFQAIHTYAC